MLKELGFERHPTVERHEKSNIEAPNTLLSDDALENIIKDVSSLKTKTGIMDLETNKSCQLFFPKSRCLCSFTNIGNVGKRPGFQERVQKEYNNAINSGEQHSEEESESEEVIIYTCICKKCMFLALLLNLCYRRRSNV